MKPGEEVQVMITGTMRPPSRARVNLVDEQGNPTHLTVLDPTWWSPTLAPGQFVIVYGEHP